MLISGKNLPIPFENCYDVIIWTLIGSLVMVARVNSCSRIVFLGAVAFLAACATPPPPAKLVATPPPRPLPALALLTAENQGYIEGVAAGERIQARHDRAKAEAAQVEASLPKPPEPAPLVLPPPTRTAVAAPAKQLPAAAPQISYVPVGPATPVASPAALGNCASGFAGCD